MSSSISLIASESTELISDEDSLGSYSLANTFTKLSLGDYFMNGTLYFMPITDSNSCRLIAKPWRGSGSMRDSLVIPFLICNPDLDNVSYFWFKTSYNKVVLLYPKKGIVKKGGEVSFFTKLLKSRNGYDMVASLDLANFYMLPRNAT